MTDLLTPDKFYDEGRKSGKVLGLRCEKGHFTLPPQYTCTSCGSRDLKITELSGRGKVISFTEVYSKSADFPVNTPYTLALVKLNEGPHLLGVLSDTQSPIVGKEVAIKFRVVPAESKERPRIFFT